MADLFRPRGPDNAAENSPIWKKLGWFAVLALGGLITVAVTAYVLRGILFMAT